jgi:hypothetical protein
MLGSTLRQGHPVHPRGRHQARIIRIQVQVQSNPAQGPGHLPHNRRQVARRNGKLHLARHQSRHARTGTRRKHAEIEVG